MELVRGHLGRIAIIGGTGLGTRLADELGPDTIQVHDCSTPFGNPSGPITTGRIGDADVALLHRHGPGHRFNPSEIPYLANMFALKTLGCTHVVATGACGSLQESIQPGDLVLCDQIIDRTVFRPRTFYDSAAVHVELADPCCHATRNWLLAAAPETGIHQAGTYICMEGPGFSTRAESQMHRSLGAHIVGMTAMPEARLAREAEMAYALVGLATDWDSWRGAGDSVLADVQANLEQATATAMQLLRRALTGTRPLQRVPSPAHSALDLAIFTEPGAIRDDDRERLKPLWGRVL